MRITWDARDCIYGEERKVKEIEIREDGLNQSATHITWDALLFTERRGGEEKRGRGEGVVTNALCALHGTRLYLLRGEEREGEGGKG